MYSNKNEENSKLLAELLKEAKKKLEKEKVKKEKEIKEKINNKVIDNDDE